MDSVTSDALQALLSSTDGLDSVVEALIGLKGDPDPAFLADPSLLGRLLERTAKVVALGSGEDADGAAAFELHRAMRRLFDLRTTAHGNRRELSIALQAVHLALVQGWVDRELVALPSHPLPAGADEDAVVAWFEGVVLGHPAADHPVYAHLGDKGTAADFRHFVEQEMATGGTFADILAMTAVGAPLAWKIEIAHNYWEEMGEGQAENAHGRMFREALESLGVVDPSAIEPSLGALVCGNLFLALSSYRCLQLLAVGALAATELAVPARFRRIVDGARRVGLPAPMVEYYEVHVEADEGHGESWIRHVVAPVIAEDPDAAAVLLAGAQLRLRTSQQYCDELLAVMESGVVAG